MLKTAIHLDQTLPPSFEIRLSQVVGFAGDVDIAAIRLLTEDGDQFVLAFPPNAGDAIKKAIDRAVFSAEQAKAAALAKLDASAPAPLSMRVPQTWNVVTSPNYGGVIVAFDKDLPGGETYGLNREAAKSMGRALISQAQQVAGRQALIVPGDERFIK